MQVFLQVLGLGLQVIRLQSLDGMLELIIGLQSDLCILNRLNILEIYPPDKREDNG